MAYGPTGAPVVITIHGSDALTELQIVEDANASTEAAASSTALSALAEAALANQVGVADLASG